MAKTILIVDDEPDICEILRFNLEMEGYDVITAESAEEGEKIVNSKLVDNKSVNCQSIDLILLDVMMTPKSGFEWARELKADTRTSGIPIIFCTAKTMEEDMLQGFALGSDDYICKPFRISEVKARVKRVAPLHLPQGGGYISTETKRNIITYPNVSPRGFCSPRNGGAQPKGMLSKERTEGGAKPIDGLEGAGLWLDLDSKECYVDGKEVVLTKLEFEVLALLLSKPGQVFSREKILNTVWPSDTIVLDRTVDVNITRIRKKIGRYGECLRTKFGYGYMFSA